jgi:hypothetical protein
MGAALEVDKYDGTYARVRLTGYTATPGVPFSAPLILATEPGPMGEVFASTDELRDLGGGMWFDLDGALGHVTTDAGVQETTIQFAAWVKTDYWVGGRVDTTSPAHPGFVVLDHYTREPIPPAGATPVEPPPVEPPPAVEPWPIDGADLAQAIGLPSTSPELDRLAVTACEWLDPYLDRSRFVAGAPWPGPIREACITIALDIYQNRTAAGGESVGYDVSAGPYRMGGALWGRVAGLVGPWAAQTSEVG